MEKVVYLRAGLIGAGIGMSLSGWWQIALICILAALIINVITRPHVGKINVEGKSVKFFYRSATNLAGVTQYSGVTTLLNEQVAFMAIASNQPVELGDLEEKPNLPSVPAKLEMHNGRVVEFVMYKEPTRCTCPVEPPHWTGTAYAGKFTEEDTDLYGSIVLIVKDQKKRRRYPRKWKFTLPQWFPRWTQPEPRPLW